ncbi:phosphopantetheine-binding protein [Caulobacter sp. SL161]|uniref:phosphopantetheine-binding protein n=1 Tax=Caulobacter sp. SL161 TaxID=2995156 RepID=UPI002274A610|nr:phosphopantetheine-binding protein [Caulobacter sp. SL161]MCY1649104.1 phosphopantetheine-binding protein [Caulobacter sp. SL161]
MADDAQATADAVRAACARRVRDLLQKRVGAGREDPRRALSDEASIANDWKADSFDRLQLVLDIEETFDIGVSDEEAETIDTIDAAVTRIMSGAWT